MGSQRESRLSRKIQSDLKLAHRHIFIFKVWGSEHMMAGLPDLIGCYHGHFFGFEVKLPEKANNTSARQDYVLGLIRLAGGMAEVITNSQQALDYLASLDDE